MNIKQFRNEVINNKELLEKLYNFILNEKYPSKVFPNEDYEFSYSSAINILKEFSFIQTNQTIKKSLDYDPITATKKSNDIEEKYIIKSIKVNPETYKRFQEFSENYEMPMSKILNIFILEGIEKRS